MTARLPRINPTVTHMDESIIREMTRVAEEAGAVNLAQGFPEYPIAEELHRAAITAIEKGVNQYTRTWGDTRLRTKLATHLHDHFGLGYDPEDELVITCGASEAIYSPRVSATTVGGPTTRKAPTFFLSTSRTSTSKTTVNGQLTWLIPGASPECPARRFSGTVSRMRTDPPTATAVS